MKIKCSKSKTLAAFAFLLIGISLCMLSLLVFYKINSNLDISIFAVSWAGNFIILFYCVIYYKTYGNIFTPFNILALFMFLFNWGQCIMWSLGIHIEGEIGTTNLYSNYAIPSDKQILDGQLFTIFMISFFLFGALLLQAVNNENSTKKISNFIVEKNVLYQFSKIAAVIVIPLVFLRILQTLYISYSYGYVALYYGENNIAGGILAQVEIFFFPVLVGLLLGSNYNKKTRRIVYAIFGLYMILYLMAGERGNWLYKLVLLIWLDHKYHKPINFKKLIKFSIISILAIYVIYAVVSLRSIAIKDIGISNILEAFSPKNFPLVSAIFEMGSNMGIIIILLIEGSQIWSGYNTYLAAILGMPATFWLKYFGIDFTYLENWFSQDILKISWGSGFSFVGEAFINGGLKYAFIYILILGIFISSITKISDKDINNHNILRVAFKVTSCNAFMTMMRGSSHSSFKAWFLGVIVYLGIVKIIANLLKIKESRKKVKIVGNN